MINSKKIKLLVAAGLSIPCALMLTACGKNDDGKSSSQSNFCSKGQCEFTHVVKAEDFNTATFWNAVSKFSGKKVNGMTYNEWASHFQIDQPVTYYVGKEKEPTSYYATHIVVCDKCGWIEQKEHTFERVTIVDNTHHHIRCTDCGFEHEEECDFQTSNPDGTDNDGCFCGNEIPNYTVNIIDSTTVTVTISDTASGEVVIPEKIGDRYVTAVDYYIQYGFSNLNITKLTIPASTIFSTNIPQNNNLKEIVITGGLNDYALPDSYLTLQNHQNLEKVTFTGGKLMGVSCTNLPKLTTIDAKGFANEVSIDNCPELTIATGNQIKCTSNDVSRQPQKLTEITLYSNPNHQHSNLTFLPKNVKTINLAENVTEIGYNSFSAINSIETINAPNLTKIEDNAFSNCTSLKTLNCPELTEIEMEAFKRCSALESINFPKLTTIGDGAFYECTGLEEANLSTVTDLGGNSFSGCTALSSVILSNELTAINYTTFQNCTALEEITIPAGVTSLGSYVFAGCINLEKIYYNAINATLHDEYTNAPFGGVGEEVTGGCEFIVGKDVESLPERLTYQSGIFETNITKFTFESGSKLRTIGTKAIACIKITSLDLPSSLETVADEAIYSCSDLVSINFGSLDLSASIMYDCPEYQFEEFNGAYYFGKQLVGIKDGTTELVVREGTTSAQNRENFVSNETKLTVTSVTMPNTITSWNVPFKSFTNLETVTLSNNLTEICDEMFNSCTKLTNVTIPNSVTKIGEYAFYNCEEFTQIVVPSSVKEINQFAFADCDNVTSVTLNEGLEKIGDYAFVYCSNLTSINIPATVRKLGTQIFKSVGSYAATPGITVTLNEGIENIGEAFRDSLISTITIPASVTTIPTDAFLDCTKLTTISIPNTVTTFGSNIFKNCTSLANVTLPSNMTSIPVNMFLNCTALEEITIPATVTSIGDGAFKNCSNLTTINISGDVTIPDSAIEGCTKYQGQVWNNGYYRGTTLVGLVDNTKSFVYIKEGTTTIAPGVFTNNTHIKGVYIPDGVTTITENEFAGCTNLTVATGSSQILNRILNQFGNNLGITKAATVICYATLDGWVYSIPDSNGLSTIAGYYGTETNITIPSTLGTATQFTVSGFEGNTTIQSVVMGDNVIAISENAFKNCTNLTSVVIGDNVYMIGANAFLGCTNFTDLTFNFDKINLYDNQFNDTGTEINKGISMSVLIQCFLTHYPNYIWMVDITL
ncbi:MAG: leucine-rich repeat protein [Clostridia bacterium]|nr:leucine-rich repeat protein [Clostridia bacterium]